MTGSTSGIGLGIATRLAAEGANVVLNGFGERAEIERLAAELKARHGVSVVYDGADMTRPAEIAAMLAKAIAQFGAVDVLVNNAGIQHVAPVEEFPPEKWDAILAINLSSSFHTVRAALPAMKARRWGRIVNIASAHALVASPFKSAYVAAKHGIAGLTKAVALEVAEQGITVNAVCPGYTDTDIVRDAVARIASTTGRSEREALESLLATNPQRRLIEPQEIAHAVLWLCSPGTQSITGQSIVLAGGEVT